MKLSVPNELFFTVFFEKEDVSKRIRDIFEEFYGEMDRAFTKTEPKEIYNSMTQDKYKHEIKWN